MIDFLSALLHQFINFLFSFTFFFLLPSFMLLFLFLVACHTPHCWSVSPSVHWAVSPLGRWSICVSVCPSVHHTLLFLGFRVLWPHCTCPNDLVASIAAPAHPHATGVAVYPALFLSVILFLILMPLPNDKTRMTNGQQCRIWETF